MNLTFRTLTAAAALCVTGAAASAATFDFTGSNQGLASSYSFSDNGLDLTVTSYADDEHGQSTPSKVGKYSNGLGVTHFGRDGLWVPDDSDHRLDGNGLNEYLIFSFSKEIDRFDSISFTYADRDDDFEIYVNDDGAWDKLGAAKVPTSGNPSTYTLQNTFMGSLFGIGANHHSDQFKIAGISATWSDAAPAPVPLPAGGLLLVSGLAGLAAARRHRKAA